MTSCPYLLSYSPGGSMRPEVSPDGAFGTQILGKGSHGGQRRYTIRKSDGGFL